MRCVALLTYGWREPGPDAIDARSLLDVLHTHDEERAREELRQRLTRSEDAAGRVTRVERLSRRRPDGARATLALVTALLESAPPEQEVELEIDVLSYGYLRGVAAFDLLVPVAPASPFKEIWPRWQRALRDLQIFESEGDRRLADALDLELYRRVRADTGRADAVVQRNILSALLIAGPSSLRDIALDLRHGPDVVLPALRVLERCGALERREDLWSVPEQVLPVVLFLLRGTMGFDPLDRTMLSTTVTARGG